MAELDIFGRGLRYPLEADGAGRLVTSSGTDRLWDTVQAILETPRGSCPMDPDFGIDLEVYMSIGDLTAFGMLVGEAIERGEPRVRDVHVEIEAFDVANGNVRVNVTLFPIDSNVPTNRVLNLYTLAEAA